MRIERLSHKDVSTSTTEGVSMYLALCDGVIDVDRWEKKSAIGLHLVEPLDADGGLLKHADESLLHFAVSMGIDLEIVLDGAEHDLELAVVGGVRIGKLPCLIELLGLDTLVDQ